MSFPRIRPDAPWTGVVLGTELQDMDSYISAAIDGDSGGSYAPTSPITIGGQGLEVTGLLSAEGTFNFVGTSFFAQASVVLLFNGDVSFGNGTVEFEDAVVGVGATFSATVQAADLIATDDATIGDALTVGGASTFNGAAEFNGNVTIDMPGGGAFVVNGASGAMFAASTLYGVVLSDVLSMTGAGRLKYRVYDPGNASVAFGVTGTNQCDIAHITAAATLTADRTWTVNDDGAFEGNLLFVSRYMDTTNWLVTVVAEGGGTITTLGLGRELSIDFTAETFIDGGYPRATLLVFRGSAWKVLASFW